MRQTRAGTDAHRWEGGRRRWERTKRFSARRVDNIDQASARGEPASVLPVATKQAYGREEEEPSWEISMWCGERVPTKPSMDENMIR